MSKKKEKIILAGGTGFIGQSLAKYFSQRGYRITILTRNPDKFNSNDKINYVKWDGVNLSEWKKELEGTKVVINLSGRTVNCRYNEKNKQQIYDSRLNSTQVIGEAIVQCEHPPELWINAGSATIYRHALDRPMDEETGEFGEGFSVDVCQKWEAKFEEMQTPNTRKVFLRIAMVLGKEGGVMKPLYNLVKLGLGGTQGKGDQRISWIHELDFNYLVEWLMEHPEIEGTFNASAPDPQPNQVFMKMLRKVSGKSFGLPATRWMLELGAIFIQTETELITKSRWVIPKKVQELGFAFQYPKLEGALDEIINGE